VVSGICASPFTRKGQRRTNHQPEDLKDTIRSGGSLRKFLGKPYLGIALAVAESPKKEATETGTMASSRSPSLSP